jgi:IS5 family transposase
VDALLDDPAFFAPFVPFFDPRIGRPSTPLETYLRMMFLKFRYRLGYESLCAEVADSISWRRFCRIPLDGKVPHPTTLMKLTTRCGSAAVEGLNEALLAKAAGHKLLRTSRLRTDTTVVPANVSYPTDCGLLARAIARIAATSARVQAAGGARRTRVRDRSRAAGRRAHAIGSSLRSRLAQGEKKAAAERATGELAVLAGLTDGIHAYFVHGYHFRPDNAADRAADVDYGGPLAAAVAQDNLFGTQFHPEKSQMAGLRLIANFLRWRP